MEVKRRISARRRRQRQLFFAAVAAVAVLLTVLIIIIAKPEKAPEIEQTQPTTEATVPETTINPYLVDTPAERLIIFAREKGLSIDEWTPEMLTLLERNPDAEEYVQNYPFLKDTLQDIDLSDQIGTGKVPLLLQWDARWGYSTYGSGPMGLTACGPTCVSMACLYFLQDAKYTPRYVADYAEENGYYVKGAGSSWTLISRGAKDLGLNVDTIPPNPNTIIKALEEGNLVICAMGPGDFTTSGHFILMVGAKDGLAIINDPNSPTNSEKLWNVAEIRDQISMLWVIKPNEE